MKEPNSNVERPEIVYVQYKILRRYTINDHTNCVTGPADYNYDESVSTLRYANRAKSIKNKPRINEDPKDAILREFQEEIARYRRESLRKTTCNRVLLQNKLPKIFFHCSQSTCTLHNCPIIFIVEYSIDEFRSS